MLGICQIGAGRIGVVHAANVAHSRSGALKYVVDVSEEAARVLADEHDAKALSDPEVALADPEVGAVLICSATNTHVDLIIQAAQANKAIFCEKPIDLDLAAVDRAIAEVEKAGVPFFVGFNRRFDPSFARLKKEISAGAIGKVEMVSITSRDPAPPSVGYLRVSGGLFRDMMIHDFDMARWLLGEEPVEVFASGSSLVDPQIAAIGDIDTAAVVLRTKSGVLCQISNSRRAVYGYDQRIEVFGERGMLQAANQSETTVSRWTAHGVSADKPPHFFLERYRDAYRAELDFFIDAVLDGDAGALKGSEDGRRALVLAEAALTSLKEQRPVQVG